MALPRTPLPEPLLAAPFTVARARELDLTRGRLRGPDLVAPTRGVRRRADLDTDVIGHARSFAVALPADCAFSHLTAARLHALPTPTLWVAGAEKLDVMRPADRPRIERVGCRHHRGLEGRVVDQVAGLRVTGVVDTWCDLAGHWDRAHLLAAADVLLRRHHVTSEELRAAAGSRAGRRGAVDLRVVAELARAGSASPGETLARYRFWSWGLPEPELNVSLLDHNGEWLAVVDFLWRAPRVVGEYDGDVHRTDRRTWQRDRVRRAAVEDDGWTYVDLTAHDLADDRAAEALRRRLSLLLLT